MRESEENQPDGSHGSHVRMVASIERFTELMLDRLAQTPSGKLMDEKETRMLASIVMRSFLIWMKARSTENRDQALKAKREQRKLTPENTEKEG